MNEEDDHGGEGKAEGAVMCLRCHVYFLALMDFSIVATAVTLRGNNSAVLKGDMFPFKGD